jgi:dolichyl-phosphate-mannose-protein mannosyltransferase
MNGARTFEFRLAAVALALGCVAGLVHTASVVGLHIPFDPNEGWNAYFAQRAMQTGSPYPPDGGFMVNNYPPLSFFVIGSLAHTLGDAIVVGRIVSLLALGFCALAIADAAREMGCDRTQATFAALLFVACILLTSDYAGMNDPQLLGHAISLFGLIVALRQPRGPRAMVASALLCVLALFVKHNLVFLPLSLAFWLLLADRRCASTFIMSGVIFSLIGLGVFRTAFGTTLFHQIASPRVYAFSNITVAVRNWLPWAVMPLCGAVLLFAIGPRDRFAGFALIYVVVSVIGGILLSGGAGVDANAMFDADIALALCAGLLLDRLENRWWGGWLALAYVISLAWLLRGVDGDWTSRDYWYRPMNDDRKVAAAEISLLRSEPNPVLCEMLSLCYWAGRQAEVDVFNIDQAMRAGARPDTQLVHQIEAKRFSLIELESLKPFPLSGGVEQALLRNYTVVRTDDERVFLKPR